MKLYTSDESYIGIRIFNPRLPSLDTLLNNQNHIHVYCINFFRYCITEKNNTDTSSKYNLRNLYMYLCFYSILNYYVLQIIRMYHLYVVSDFSFTVSTMHVSLFHIITLMLYCLLTTNENEFWIHVDNGILL